MMRQISLLILFVMVPWMDAADISFRRDLAPVLVQKCLACHGPKKAKGSYRVDTFAKVLMPGDTDEPMVTAGKPDMSELFYRLSTDDADERMPQDDDPLPPEVVAKFRQWIEAGAKYDGGDPKALLSTILPAPRHPDPPAKYPRAVPITALTFSADGQSVFVSGYHEVSVWGAGDGKLQRRIAREGERTYGLSASPDGKWLATASGQPGRLGEVRLFEASTGKLDRVLATAPDVMLDVAFDPAGQRLVAGGADGQVLVIDLASRKVTHTLGLHSDWVNAVTWDDNGSRFATASRDHTAKVFDLAANKSLVTFAGHGKNVRGIAFHPGGRELYSSGMDKKVQLWRISDGKRVRDIGFSAELFKLVRHDKVLVVPAADNRVRRYQANNLNPLGDFALEDWAVSVAISPDGKHLAAGGFNGQVRIWNLEDGKELNTFIAIPGLK
ncbi:MAG: hypothetical protein H8E27_09775 [Verrucomicrobia subdivision 3 bacterium]|nr:hypothetical protein [Limisphaerales bacterium]